MKLFKKIWDFFKKILKDFVWKHHTENDVINIQIIQGKDHNHLIIRIRNIDTVLGEEIKDKELIIQKINKFLEYYKNNVIGFKTDKNQIKKYMEDKSE